MNKDSKFTRNLSRRDTLKACLVPATAALTGRWLSACSAAEGGSVAEQAATAGSTASPQNTPATSSGAAGKAPAANGGSSASTANALAGTGATASPAGGSAAPAANSGGGTGGTSQASAGTGAAAGSPATGGTAAGAGGAAAQAGAGGSLSTVAGPNVMWATGGTAKMAATYPDPFEQGVGASCKLYPAQTLGPCYADDPMMRTDISDGLDGLPMRLSFLVVGADGCTPVPNATVDIWHSGSQGVYSAYATGTTCNPGTENVMSDMFCRGVQAVDETGRVNFATVFPGWYRGRTLHIHFTLRVGGREEVTSQLYFEDSLVDEILAQGSYKARGKRDTTNTRDGIFSSGNATPEQVILEHVKRPDGILHAWKVLSIG
jgi:protocatechuate 3,4-dioxygenase beta subunit